MFSEDSIKIMETVDKYVSDMNNKTFYPYYFTWSFPINHRHEDDTNISYFCINIGKYLIQETEDTIERNIPIEIPYFFGRLKNINKCVIPEDIADCWNKLFTRIIQRNYFALDNAARGYNNINNSEFMIDASKDSEDEEMNIKD